MAQTIKSLPAMQGTEVRFLAREDPLEEGMATHSSILVWKIPWTEEPGGLQSMGSQRSRTRLSDYYYVPAFIVSLSYLALGLAFFCQMTSAGNNRKSHSIWPKG